MAITKNDLIKVLKKINIDIGSKLNSKVDKISGKNLSTNDYTTDEKNKLAGISIGANKVVNSSTNGVITIDGTSATVYSHPTGDGNLHVPATGTANNGKVLTAGTTAGSLSWVALPTSLPANGGNADTVDGKHASEFVPGSAGTGSSSVILNNISGNVAIGPYSTAMGYQTTTYGMYSYTEGFSTNKSDLLTNVSSGPLVIRSNWETSRSNNSSFSLAYGNAAHSEGKDNLSLGDYSHAEGNSTAAYGEAAHSEGDHTTAYGNYSHSEGCNTTSLGKYSHCEGNSANSATNIIPSLASASITDITNTWLSNPCSIAYGESSHVGGNNCLASGAYSFAHGDRCLASEYGSIVFGYMSMAKAQQSFVFGNNCSSTGTNSLIIGTYTTGVGNYGFSQGLYSYAVGNYSTSKGFQTTAKGDYSTCVGNSSTAGKYSTTFGENLYSPYYMALINGRNNKYTGTIGSSDLSFSITNPAYIIGNGDSSGSRSNAFRVTFDGKVYGLSAFNSTGADYAEYFEWEDGNPDNEDRIGKFVTLDTDKIRIANENDQYILGVISGNASIIGNACEDSWNDMYMRDAFGRLIYEDVKVEDKYQTIPVAIDENTNDNEEIMEKILISEAGIERRIKLNPNYDPNLVYIPRSERKEWGVVGMLGQLPVYDDGTCVPGGFCKVSNNGLATKSDTGYRVMKRLSDNIVQIIIK